MSAGGRGYLRIRHIKSCGAPEDPNDAMIARKCRCEPKVEARFGRSDTKPIGYLPRGWTKADLDPFYEALAELRAGRTGGRPWKTRTIGSHFDEWLDRMYEAAVDGSIAKNTYNAYEQRWRRHLEPQFGGLLPQAVTPAMLRKFVLDKRGSGLSKSYSNELLTPLSGLFTDLMVDGVIASNPCRIPKRGRHGLSKRNSVYLQVERDDPEHPKHLEVWEARALLNAVEDDAFRLMLRMDLTTGFRRAEISGTKWEEIDWAKRTITIHGQIGERRQYEPRLKGGFPRRTAPLTASVIADLGRRRQAEGYIFTEPDGGPWRPYKLDREHLTPAYEAAGLLRAGTKWHALRHTANSVMHMQSTKHGVATATIEIVMGHKRSGTNASYTHALDEQYALLAGAMEEIFGADHDRDAASVITSARPPAVRVLHGVDDAVREDDSARKERKKRF